MTRWGSEADVTSRHSGPDLGRVERIARQSRISKPPPPSARVFVAEACDASGGGPIRFPSQDVGMLPLNSQSCVFDFIHSFLICWMSRATARSSSAA